MKLFKKKKQIDEKTIKLSDLIYAIDQYKNIYNECIKEVGLIVVRNSEHLNDAPYFLHYYLNTREFEAVPYVKENEKYRYSKIYDTYIRNLITLYAPEEIKEKINMLEQTGYLFSGMKIKCKDICSNISSTSFNKRLVSSYYTNYIEFSKIGEVKDKYNILKNMDIANPEITINNATQYNQFIEFLSKHETKNELFDEFGNLYDIYKGKTLENHDLSTINFDDKNISGIDISRNLNVNIHFDKIKSDISNCNFNGYNLKDAVFRHFNIMDTDFRNTSATIDLATCMITLEGKMNSGTLFDENNTFVFEQNELSHEDVRNLGIKIYKKEKKDEKR